MIYSPYLLYNLDINTQVLNLCHYSFFFANLPTNIIKLKVDRNVRSNSMMPHESNERDSPKN